MTDMIEHQFAARAARISVRGIGLSVDIYSPDLLELRDGLAQAGLQPDYLEVFKAPVREMRHARQAFPSTPFAYHAEGLWLTEPDLQTRYPWAMALETIARHAESLEAVWVNHECASKQLGGYSFGTYLPPVFTGEIAKVTARHAVLAQTWLDEWYARQGHPDAAPLLLLELAPLPYFGFGDLSAAEFFARVAAEAPCGLVLDLGHLWTVWRYGEGHGHIDLRAFLERFLEVFPLHRVVQIHLAGLAAAELEEPEGDLPWWIDAHEARVPAALYDLLAQVITHPALTSLKGIALEVDTKSIPVIIEEFDRLRGDPSCHRLFYGRPQQTKRHEARAHVLREESLEDGMGDLSAAYARIITGQETPGPGVPRALMAGSDPEGVRRYTAQYLPRELLQWGGDLAELFPAVWTELGRRGLNGADFVRFWVQEPGPVSEPYDFFLIKLERWAAFVRHVAPDLLPEVERETAILRAFHAELSEDRPERARSPSA